MRLISRESVLAGIVALAPLAAAQATVVYVSNQFESETPNTASGVPSAGYDAGKAAVTIGTFSVDGNMLHPLAATTISQYGGRGATVFAASQSAVTGFASQCVGLFSHPLPWGGTHTGSVSTAHPSGANGPLTGTTTGKYVFAYDMTIASGALTTVWAPNKGSSMSLKANFWDSNLQHMGNLPLFTISDSLGVISLTSSADAPGGTAMTTTLVPSATALTVYHIATTLDMDTRTFTVAINDQAIPGTFNQLLPSAPGLGIGEYAATGGVPSGTSFQGFSHFYDNIYLATAAPAVPEPVSVSIVGLGSMLLLRRSRKPVPLA